MDKTKEVLTDAVTALKEESAKDSTDTLFDKARLAQALARLEAEQSKQSLEFSRYKQDCRKRALECAIDECRRVGGFTPIIKDPSKLVHQEEAKPFDILAEAEKYYQWLITIPQ